MFGLPHELVVTICHNPSFYSLYVDGLFIRKQYDRHSEESRFAFSPGSVLFLYYTYPTSRALSVIRNVPGSAALPGLSRKVTMLFTVHASRVDKLRRAIGFLNTHAGGAYHHDDAFYTRLYFIMQQRGKLNRLALHKLTQRSTT